MAKILQYKNIQFIITIDIIITLIILSSIIYSLIPNNFYLVPFEFSNPYLGINQLRDIFTSLHYILIGITSVFIVQSFLMLSESKKNTINENSIMKLLLLKWIMLNITTSIPYLFKTIITPIPLFYIIIISLTLLFLIGTLIYKWISHE